MPLEVHLESRENNMKNKHKLVPFEKFNADLMKDPKFVEEYKKREEEFMLAQELTNLRVKYNLSETELIRRIDTL